MSNLTTFQLNLPSRPNETATHTITVESPVVITGANGSGKTRFGSWIETQELRDVHRIAAQKSLTFPESVRPPEIEAARHQLLYGYFHREGQPISKHIRWNSNPTTGLLNDYERLLEFLFSEQTQRNAEVIRIIKETGASPALPESKLDIVQRIWEKILPEKMLLIQGGKVEAQKRSASNAPFDAAQMSDGERVIFYLIGQVLSALPNSKIVIDEPELHLHKGIQSQLWNEIEAERPDCLFIYITHDLDFAASRFGATRIWLKEFDGNAWDWEILSENMDLPEHLLLRVLGSRKKVLFVEGANGGFDEEVYSHLYPDWTVTPCGSCEHVIHATGAYSGIQSLHHLWGRGLIDNDERTPAESNALRNSGVYLLGFSEIENIFLIRGVLEIAALRLIPGEDPSEILTRVQTRILESFDCNRDRIASKRVVRRLQDTARYFQTNAIGSSEIGSEWQRLYQASNVSELYDTESLRIQQIIDSNDYDSAIRIYPNKGLIHEVNGLFGSTNLQRYLRKLLAAPDGKVLRDKLREYLPVFQ